MNEQDEKDLAELRADLAARRRREAEDLARHVALVAEVEAHRVVQETRMQEETDRHNRKHAADVKRQAERNGT